MPRYIDADMLRQRMYHEAFETDTDMQKWDSGCWIRYKLFENCIDDAPTLSPDEVRGVGEWIEAAGGNYLVCPECKYDHALYDRLGYSCEHEYCPNCGKRLRMKGAGDAE